MKYVKGWEEEEDEYALFASPAKKKGQKNSLKDDVVTVERLETKQQIVLTREVRKRGLSRQIQQKRDTKT